MPPPLPPLLSAVAAVANPQQPPSLLPVAAAVANPQQPPPLPPLPPSLASKYSLSVKTYQLESEKNSHLTNAAVVTTLNNTNETTSKAAYESTTPVSLNSFDQLEARNINKSERRAKATSICSDSDNYLKDFINEPAPQVDTNSESMSGGELSGETFASPVTTADSGGAAGLQLNRFDTSVSATNLAASLLVQSTAKVNISSNVVNESPNSSLFSGNTTDTGASGISNNGLLLIDSRSNDERSASFIDSKCKFFENISSLKKSTLNRAPLDLKFYYICKIKRNHVKCIPHFSFKTMVCVVK